MAFLPYSISKYEKGIPSEGSPSQVTDMVFVHPRTK